ncbi:glycerate kinase [Hominiventricola aquisgranensis]|jgi:glycerate 2-kinase|uniref:Glycerate kinase n=1 Tax=Hominiventricola aquisgranensis TaxID=3133164 RepID=A0ABV1HZ49_9FIRM|nr:glycerate kinase [Clostridiaceae bacterium]
MKIVIAIDSLKGSLSSMEAGHAIEQGIRNVLPETKVLVKPLADGGEGTTEALVEGLGGDMVQVQVHGPLETPVNAAYGVIRESNTAIMEMAAAAGIILVGKDKRPLDATTYGVGEMIRDAITRGCREFIIGIGGSATNDGGIGMLTALGYEFLDAEGKPAGIGAGALYKVAKICDDKVMPELKDCHFRIACDVTNPLCGENGSTYIYGPQKGVTVELRDELDHAMGAYAQVVKAYNGTDYAKTPGAGAAGGLGFAFLSFLSGELLPGIELVLNAVEMDKAMEGADLVFTGEGRLDYQTAMGKAPVGIAKMAKKHGAKVIALAGAVIEGAQECNEQGIDAYFPILRQVVTLDEAMDPATARKNMVETTEQVMRLVAAVK